MVGSVDRQGQRHRGESRPQNPTQPLLRAPALVGGHLGPLLPPGLMSCLCLNTSLSLALQRFPGARSSL